MSTPRRPPNDCFALPPGVDWIPVDDALARLEAAMRPATGVEQVPLMAAAGRYLAEDVMALRAHPAVDNAAVDGFAFHHPGGPKGVETTFDLLEGRSAAGAPFEGLVFEGQAVKILTGAAMPEGADTVALQEDATVEAGAVRLPLPKPGANRRRAGENLETGARALAAETRLDPAALAQAASAGWAELPVRKTLRVAALSTGDEIAPAGVDMRSLRRDQVLDANRPMLLALARELGFDAVDLGVAPDTRAAVEAALAEAAAAADVILTSGGASGGEEDHIARALSDAAARDAGGFHQWRVAVKPGRPLAMGMWNGRPVFGLPGNPVAAFVCFLIFVRPALARLAGGRWPRPARLMVPSGFDYPKKPGRREFLRVRLGDDGRLEKFRSEGSGLIDGLLWSDGLADLPHEAGPIAEGAPMAYLSYAELGIRR